MPVFCHFIDLPFVDLLSLLYASDSNRCSWLVLMSRNEFKLNILHQISFLHCYGYFVNVPTLVFVCGVNLISIAKFTQYCCNN